MSEAILSCHHVSFQATYQRNSKAVPIDGIFTSDGVPVKNGGYYNFDEFISSDHRALWIDFDLKTTLGGHTPEKKLFQARKLVATDKPSVRRYLQQVESDYIFYDVPRRLDRLQQILTATDGNMTPALKRQYNCLHEQMYMIRRQAEASCRKIKAGKVPWSPKMQAFWDRIALWRILIKSRTKCQVSSRKVRRLMKKTNLGSAWKLQLPKLQAKLKDELASYRKAKQFWANKWRKSHLEAQLRSARKKQWRNAKAGERFLRLRWMKQREEARGDFALSKLKKNRGTRSSFVLSQSAIWCKKGVGPKIQQDTTKPGFLIVLHLCSTMHSRKTKRNTTLCHC